MEDSARGADAPATAASLLRAETGEDHRRAERSEFQRRFVSGQLPRELYVRWLEQMWWVYAALEEWLWTAPLVERHPALLDGRRRTPELRADLAHFGLAQRDLRPTRAACAFAERLSAWGAERSPALLGVLYVLEGSTNGSRHIARAVRAGYGLSGREGCAFLDPYGDDQPARWAEFRRHLDAAVAPAEMPDALDGARAAFDAFSRIGAELLEPAGD